MIIHECIWYCGLHALIIHMNDASPITLLRDFDKALCEDKWLVDQVPVYYPAFGNSIDGTARIMLGIHSSDCVTESPQVITLPVNFLSPIDSYILQDFLTEN